VTAEQEQKLNDVAAELFEYVESVKIIKDFFDKLPNKLGIASPYLNLRDALFHFRKMYICAGAKNDSGFNQQYACVMEHLNRGLKDFGIHVCSNLYTDLIYEMINTKSVNNENRQILRKIYHNIKNIVIDIRVEGQTLQHFDDNKNLWLPKFAKAIGAFHSLVKKNPSLEQLYRRLTSE